MYIVQLRKGVWLTKWKDTPKETTEINKAQQFKYKNWARHGLKMARKYKSYPKAKVKFYEKNKNHG